MREQIVQGTEIEQEYSCCDGKVFFITDKKQVLITFMLTSSILVLHYIFHVSWFSTSHNFLPLYVLFITHFLNFWAFLVILTSNPGIIQKIAYEYESDMNYIDVPKNELSRSHIQIANIMTVRSNISKLKLCSTCNIYRPPRTHHCSECGVCIERMDHHCPWLGVCIGKYNYKYFYLFLLSLMVAIVTTAAMCIAMMAGDGKVYPLAIILVLLCAPAFLFVGSMLGFHTYISAINLTTKEYLDEFWSQVAGNPNTKPFFVKNFLKTFFIKTQRQIKYKYIQYYVKSEGQSSSEQKMSSDNNNQHNHSLSRASESQKRESNSNSDEINMSRDKGQTTSNKPDKSRSFEKENEYETGVPKHQNRAEATRIKEGSAPGDKVVRLNYGEAVEVLKDNVNSKTIKQTQKEKQTYKQRQRQKESTAKFQIENSMEIHLKSNKKTTQVQE